MAFVGEFLDADLTRGSITMSPLAEDLAKNFLGGRGLNVWLLYQNVTECITPVAPENVLILGCGLLTGTTTPTASRLHVTSKSPHTGILGSSSVGGGFGAALRSCGFQCILIRGRADRPVYLWIGAGQGEIRDASCLKGLDTRKTQESLRALLGEENPKILAIGPGGENLVSFACIMTDHDHVAGRTGMGAVMGSKNLKAVVVKGCDTKASFHSSTVSAFRAYLRKIESSPRFREVSTYGSSCDIRWTHNMGMLATRNYRDVRFEDIDRIEGKEIHKHVTRTKGCSGCPVRCKANIRIDHGQFKGMEGARPEFESIIALGSKCGLSDTGALLYLSDLCSRLGIDTISTGSVIAFAMDLYDRDILTREDTGGINLTWGNHEAMETLLHRIAGRHGLGAILSLGVRKAAEIIGRGSDAFAYHTKGLELTGYDPRGLMGTALGYAVSERGGDFSSVYATLEYRWSAERAERQLGNRRAVDRFSPEGKGPLIRRAMVVSAVLDSLGLCKVPALTLIGDFDLKNEAVLTRSVTGWPLDANDLFHIGERIVNVERLFNLRNGAGVEADRISAKFINEAVDEGPCKGSTVRLEPMLKEFYRVMGWDQTGHPVKAKLAALDLVDDPHRIRKGQVKVSGGGRKQTRPDFSIGNYRV
jgi:aldehyde:ferredoxin oxidoreductase